MLGYSSKGGHITEVTGRNLKDKNLDRDPRPLALCCDTLLSELRLISGSSRLKINRGKCLIVKSDPPILVLQNQHKSRRKTFARNSFQPVIENVQFVCAASCVSLLSSQGMRNANLRVVRLSSMSVWQNLSRCQHLSFFHLSSSAFCSLSSLSQNSDHTSQDSGV